MYYKTFFKRTPYTAISLSNYYSVHVDLHQQWDLLSRQNGTYFSRLAKDMRKRQKCLIVFLKDKKIVVFLFSINKKTLQKFVKNNKKTLLSFPHVFCQPCYFCRKTSHHDPP